MVQNVNVRVFGGTNLFISVGPKWYEREIESLHCNLGRTDYANSVRPILVID